MLVEEAGKKNIDRRSSGEYGTPAAITDAGCERDLNEDRYAVIESASGLAWVVCDGMGGNTGGELAAQLAIDAMRRDLEHLPQRPTEDALRGAILEANRIIVLRRQNQAFAQMGTTVVAALFSLPEVVVAHVGDSRAYLIRAGAIQQLTTDHTYVQELVDRGQIRAEEALSHPDAHILTRCVGAEPGLNTDAQRYWIWQTKDGEATDVLLLCSDGLYSQVTESEMADIISREPPQRACVTLVELAKARGGYDNISLAIVPLGGQLKDQPPTGYDSRLNVRARYGSEVDPKRGMARDVAIIVTLVIVVVFLTVLAFALFIRQ